jgi:hypothetical protein
MTRTVFVMCPALMGPTKFSVCGKCNGEKRLAVW